MYLLLAFSSFSPQKTVYIKVDSKNTIDVKMLFWVILAFCPILTFGDNCSAEEKLRLKAKHKQCTNTVQERYVGLTHLKHCVFKPSEILSDFQVPLNLPFQVLNFDCGFTRLQTNHQHPFSLQSRR